jgi:glyoxylase I family protein
MKLEHVALNVPDPKAAAAWYAENLNLRVVKASDTGPFVHFLADDSGSMLELYNNPAGEVPQYQVMSPFTLHLAFTVEDIPATHQKLVTAGATPVGETQTTAEGDQLAFLRDPWGMVLQLVKRRKPLLER